MDKSFHYLLMANQSLIQKLLFSSVSDTQLTSGQPKVLDYLKNHNGANQKEIAAACHIEPATLTSVLTGMEKKDLIKRSNLNGDRRSLHVFLTDKGSSLQKRVDYEFSQLELQAFNDFTDIEKTELIDSLIKVYNNLSKYKEKLNG